MVSNVLLDVIKTDFNQKQNNFETTYTSKDTSNSFMKIFETANKSYNFNNNKMKEFSGYNQNEDPLKKFSADSNSNQNFFNKNEELTYSYENPSGHSYQANHSLNGSQNHSPVEHKGSGYNGNHTQSDRTGNNQHAQEIKTENASNIKTESQASGEGSKKAENNGEQNQKTDKASREQSQGNENNKAGNEKGRADDAKNSEVREKQGQQNVKAEQTKDTTGKLMLEKTGAEHKEVKNDTAAQPAKKEPVIDPKAEKPQQPAEKTDKAETANNANNIEIKEKGSKEKSADKEVIADKSKRNNASDENRTALPANSRQVEQKEDLKIENIKAVSNSELQKTVNDSMTKQQGQFSSGQESRANISQAASSEGGAQKIDAQKAAQFEKTLSSKQADSTQKSVLNQVKNASSQLNNGKSEVSINLRPDNLGKVNINLVSQKGELTAQITAENQQVKEMLAKGLDSLRQGLSEQGVNVNRVVVNVQDSSSTKNEADFEGADAFDQNSDSSETETEAENGENLSENQHEALEYESYDFEEEGEDSDKTGDKKPARVSVDYKV